LKISGFSFVRNATIYDFPLEESLASLLPICDEVVVAVGKSDDDTLDRVRAIPTDKIRIIETVWDETLRQGGKVYAQQTDIALAECTGDWCIYLQADEVLHEEDYQMMLDEIRRADAEPTIEALLFRYIHFYGSYNYIGAGRKWYRRELRAVRNTGQVMSWGDAQGFRRRGTNGRGELLRARQTEIRVFHYGWVRPPALQADKQRAARRFWYDDEWLAKNPLNADQFDYSGAYELHRFDGSHPAVMSSRINRANGWTRGFDPSRTRPKPLLMRITDWVERHTGWRIAEYRNFVEIR